MIAWLFFPPAIPGLKFSCCARTFWQKDISWAAESRVGDRASLQGPRSSTLCDHLCELAITNNSRKVLTWAFEWMPPITQWWIKPVSRYQLWRFMCSPSIRSLAVSCWSSQTGGCSSISIRLLCGRIDLVPIMDGMREHRHHCVICWIKDTDRLPMHSFV